MSESTQQTVITFYGIGVGAYAEAVGTALRSSDAPAYLLGKTQVIGLSGDVLQVVIANQSGDGAAVGKASMEAIGSIVGGVLGGSLGVPGAVAGSLIGSEIGEWVWDTITDTSPLPLSNTWEIEGLPIETTVETVDVPMDENARDLLDKYEGMMNWYYGFETAEEALGSPIVLDLDGDGVETVSLTDGAYFDHDGNGFAERTGWVGSDDALLVWDRNLDGQIRGGSELFGNETPLVGGGFAANGFEALAELDANTDGVINVNDSVWGDLKAWRDFNGDGLSSDDELFDLAAVGVESINVGYAASSFVDAHGNEHRQVGSITMTNSAVHEATDVWFQRDLKYTVAEEWLEVPSTYADLPDLMGFGNVRSLHQAMVRDGDLYDLVEDFVAEADPEERNAIFTQILFKWTGVGSFWDTGYGDGRHIEVLEGFFGEEYVSVESGYHVVNPIAAGLLADAYQGVYEMFYSQLMAQSHLKNLYDKITLSWDGETQRIVTDFSEVISDLSSVPTFSRETVIS